MDEIFNGQHWEQKDFPYFRGFVQWLTQDTWVFMSEPEKGRLGQMVSIPFAEEDGKIFYTQEEMLHRMQRYNYTPI